MGGDVGGPASNIVIEVLPSNPRLFRMLYYGVSQKTCVSFVTQMAPSVQAVGINGSANAITPGSPGVNVVKTPGQPLDVERTVELCKLDRGQGSRNNVTFVSD